MSAQHQAFNNKRDELVTGIKHSVNTIADKCLGKGLITEETYNEVTQSEKDISHKARQLLRNISGGIRENPVRFDILLAVLTEASCDVVADKLISEWKDLENRGTIKQPEQVDGDPDSTTNSGMSTLRHQETGVRRRVGVQMIPMAEEQPVAFSSSFSEGVKICTDQNDPPSNGESLVVGLDHKHRKPTTQSTEENDVATMHSTFDEEVQQQISCLEEKMEENEKERNKLNKENNNLGTKIEHLEDRLSAEEKRRHREEKMRRESEKQVSDLTAKNVELFREIDKLHSDKKEVERRLDDLEKQNNGLCKEIEELKEKQKSVLEESLKEKQGIEETIKKGYEKKVDEISIENQRKYKKAMRREEYISQNIYALLNRDRKKDKKCFTATVIVLSSAVIVLIILVTYLCFHYQI